MNVSILLSILCVGVVSTAPAGETNEATEDKHLVITDEFFVDELKVYEGQYDIVKIMVPLNKLNFEDDESLEDDTDTEVTLFFIEADINGDDVADKGLYIKKGNNVTKLLNHGRDAAAPRDHTDFAYFATKDGIYVYNAEKNTAEKFGTIDDDLIGIVVGNTTDEMYVLTADKKVYKIFENGNEKEAVESITSAEQIMLDNSNNLFYVDSEKKVHVVNSAGDKKIETLPNFSKITLLRPALIFEEGIPVVIDKKGYTLHPNDTLEDEHITLNTEVTAYAMDAAFLQYYSHEKKIYEYNILSLLLGTLLEELHNFLENLKNDINAIAARPKSQFRNKRFIH